MGMEIYHHKNLSFLFIANNLYLLQMLMKQVFKIDYERIQKSF